MTFHFLFLDDFWSFCCLFAALFCYELIQSCCWWSILSEFLWIDGFLICFWCYDSVSYSNSQCSRFHYFSSFWVGYILLWMHCLYFLLLFPFFTVSGIWGMIFYTIYTRVFFITILAIVSKCTATAADECSSTWNFWVSEILAFKATQRVRDIRSYGALKVSCFYWLWKFRRVYCKNDMLCRNFIVVSGYCYPMYIGYTLIFQIF